MVEYFEYLEKRFTESWNETIMSTYKIDSFTGKEVYEKIVSMHIFFKKSGFMKGNKAAIYGANSARWAIAFLAINTYEGVAVPILSDFLPEDASNLTEHSEATILFTDKSSWERMDPKKMRSLQYVISLDDFSILWSIGTNTISTNTIGTNTILEYTNGKIEWPKGNGNNLAIINYTSGTTSRPKGVMISYDNISTNVQFAIDHIPPKPKDRIVSMLPLAHMYGFMFEFLYPLCGGVEITFLGKAPTPSILMGALGEIKPYILITVPLVMEKIFKNSVLPKIKKTRILMSVPGISNLIRLIFKNRLMSAFGGKIRYLVMGGAPLNPDIEKWMKRLHLPYTVGYGMTEASPLLAFESWRKFSEGSCGKVADRCRIRIKSDNPQKNPGEIQAQGINIMMGYYKNEEATSSAFTKDGWFRTGDFGVIDAKGNIYIRGRSKNMFLSSNGQNIYPEEIESVVNSIDGVQESVVVSRNSKIIALVYTAGKYIAEDILQQKINSNLPAYCRLNRVELVSAPFEKTPKMSIKRYLYR